MAVYFIADIEVTDPESFEGYKKRVAPIVEKYGGRYLVRGGEPTAVEGDWKPTRIVVLEFPSEEQLKRVEEQLSVRPLRQWLRHTASVPKGLLRLCIQTLER